MATVLGAFAPLVSRRVFEHAKLLVVGAILAPSKRPVTSMLRVMGKRHDQPFQNSHRGLNRAQGWPLEASHRLLRLLLDAFVPQGPVVLGLDESSERRRGETIAAKGIDREPVRSSPTHVVKARGLRWVSLMRLTRLPWAARVWALPVLTVLAPSERHDQARGRRAHALLDRARQAVRLVQRWLPTRALVVGGDQTDAALAWLDAVRDAACVITRVRLDAALYEPAPPRPPRQNGRPRTQGKRLPALEKVLSDPLTHGTTVTMANWYGEAHRRGHRTSNTAVWYHAGKPVVPIRWVLIRDPHRRVAPQALLATHPQLRPVQLLTSVVQRWQIAVTCEEARAQLGVETPRQWRERATARTPPALLALDSLVPLRAAPLIGTHPLPVRTAAGYRKAHATFADTMALGRHSLWPPCHCSTSQAEADVVKLPRHLVARVTDALCDAA